MTTTTEQPKTETPRPLSHEERYARYGGWVQTHTGKTFFFADMQPEDICIEDIAHALSNYCRFAGHCDDFYSVAQHSCFVADLLKPFGPQVELAGLLHDATEAYMGDVTRPLKRLLPDYAKMEDKLSDIIGVKFAVTLHDPRVKWADNMALMTEARDLLGPKAASWGVKSEVSPITVIPWSPRQSKKQFLSYFDRLCAVNI